jgi:peptidoglycan hydrolase CwlO-like protein
MNQTTSYHIFNTHEYIKSLIKAGMTEELSEVIVRGLIESREYDFSKLATKEKLEIDDLKEQVNDLKEQINDLKKQMKVLIDSTEEQIHSLRNEVKLLPRILNI